MGRRRFCAVIMVTDASRWDQAVTALTCVETFKRTIGWFCNLKKRNRSGTKCEQDAAVPFHTWHLLNENAPQVIAMS